MKPVAVIAIVGVAGAAWAGWELAAPAEQTRPLFECRAPKHHDGDAVTCEGQKSMRLDSIDAPEMPGACRAGRECTAGDPFAARDHLASLTRARDVQCRHVDADRRRAGFQETDHYGRRIARCFADGIDVSCRMVADGFAVERYGKLDCAR